MRREKSGVAKMTRRDMSGGKTTGGDMSGVVKVCKGICPEPPPKMTGGGLSWRGFVQSGKNDRRGFVRSGKNDMGGLSGVAKMTGGRMSGVAKMTGGRLSWRGFIGDSFDQYLYFVVRVYF